MSYVFDNKKPSIASLKSIYYSSWRTEMADNSGINFREVVKALNDVMDNHDDINFDVTLAECLGFKNKYRVHKTFNWYSNKEIMIYALFSLSLH